MPTPLPQKFAKPAQRALAVAGIVSLEALCNWTEADLAALHGIGPNVLAKLREALAAAGLTFR